MPGAFVLAPCEAGSDGCGVLDAGRIVGCIDGAKLGRLEGWSDGWSELYASALVGASEGWSVGARDGRASASRSVEELRSD